MLTALAGVLWLHHGICECPGSLQTVVITFNDEIQFRAQTAHRSTPIGALTAAVCGIYMLLNILLDHAAAAQVTLFSVLPIHQRTLLRVIAPDDTAF